MRTLTKSSLVWAWLLVAAAFAHAAEPDSDAPLTEEPPAYTLEQAQAYLREVRPLVERITGRKMARIPPIKLITRQEYIDAAARAKPKSPKEESIIPWARYAFGSYDPARKAIHLLAGNFKPRLRRAGVPDQYHDTILKMIIAHELTHALQHEQARRPKQDSYCARATIEGHATFVMYEVAEAVNADAAIGEFEKTIGAGLTLSNDPKKADANRALRKRERSVYIDGAKFIAWHYKRGGNARAWRIIRYPPTSQSQILHPETYVERIPIRRGSGGRYVLPVGPMAQRRQWSRTDTPFRTPEAARP